MNSLWTPTRVHPLATTAAAAGGYALFAMLGRALSHTDHSDFATLWPPVGLALAALLVFGRSRQVPLLTGFALGNLLFNAAVSVPLWQSLVFCAANLVEAVLAAWLVRRHVAGLFDADDDGIGRQAAFDGRFVRGLAIAAALAPVPAALIGGATVQVSGLGLSGLSWATWWCADALGIVVVAPLALLALSPVLRAHSGVGATIELLGVLLLIVLVSALMTNSVLEPVRVAALMPLLTWAALRHGLRGAAAANAVMVLSIVSLKTGAGGDLAALAMLQMRLGTFALVTLLIAALFGERRHAEAALQAAADKLAQGRQQDARALQNAHQREMALIEALPTVVFETDASGTQQFASGAWSRFTGLPAEQALGDQWHEAVHPDDRAEVAERWRAGLSDGRLFRSRHRLRRAGGGWCWCEVRSVPVRASDGRIERWVGTVTDVDELVCTQARLAAADARKDEFIALLAHELRNPLAPIRSAASLLAVSPHRPDLVAQSAAVIERQSLQLSRLVDDLLDVARVSSGKLVLQRTRQDLRSIVETGVETGVETARPLLDARRQHLTLQLPPAGALAVDGDLARLAQAVGNLVCNAAKFTPVGGHVDVQLRATGDGQAAIDVRDDGIGIEPGLLPQLFDMFMQADDLQGQRGGGLGIGLALVKRLTELHGGTVAVASDGPGCGARFTMRLPLAAAWPLAEPPPHQATARARRRQRVLIVDDNADAADMLSLLLISEGHAVTVCTDATIGRDQAQAERFDVVLLDLGMPRLDGYAVARALRAHGASQQAMLIAVTGYGQPEDRAQCARAGFDAHLVKPVDVQALCQRLAQGDTSLALRIAERMRHPQLHRFFDAWCALRDGRKLPALAELLKATAAFEPQRAVARVDSREPFSMHFLQVGDQLERLLPGVLPGTTLTQGEADAGTQEAAYRQVAISAEPALESTVFDFGDGDPMYCERLIVPACDGQSDGKPSHLVSMVLFEPTPPAPEATAASLALAH